MDKLEGSVRSLTLILSFLGFGIILMMLVIFSELKEMNELKEYELDLISLEIKK